MYYDKRKGIVYSNKLNYSIRQVEHLDRYTDMKDLKVNKPQENKDIIMKDLTDRNIKWIEYCNLSNTYEEEYTQFTITSLKSGLLWFFIYEDEFIF